MPDQTIGRKRSLPANDKLPEKFAFTFTPSLSPGQKLFDQEQLNASFEPTKWSPAALTHRFRKRATRARILAPQLDPQTIQPQHIRHEQVSTTLISWLQVLFNSFLALVILYIVFTVLWTLRHDFRIKTEEHTAAILDEIAVCNRNYGINGCDPRTRVPALEKQCNMWESCKNRDPLLITRSKLSAEMAAEILNSFVEPISYKTLFFLTVIVIGSLVVSNTASRLYRQRMIEDR